MKLSEILTGMFWVVIAAAILAVVTGCAGQAQYVAEPVDINGQPVCCKVSIENSKDIGSVVLTASKGADGSVYIQLEEIGVNASTPMAVQADLNAEVARTGAALASGAIKAATIGGALDTVVEVAPAAAAVILAK